MSSPRALIIAAQRSGVDALRQCLAEGADVNPRERGGRTALFYCVAPFGPDMASVELLLSAGADINARTDDYENLIQACYAGVSSAIEAHSAKIFARRALKAGFKPLPSDLPSHGTPRLWRLERRLDELSSEELITVELSLCAQAAQRYSDAELIDVHGLDATLPTRLYTAVTLGRATSALDYELKIATARVFDRKLPRPTRMAFLAIHNLYHRHLHQDPTLSAALVISQALRAEPQDALRWDLLDDTILHTWGL